MHFTGRTPPEGYGTPSVDFRTGGTGGGALAAIVVSNISKTYTLYSSPVARIKEVLRPSGKGHNQRFSALTGVSLQVAKGEIVGIIGRNGSGKTTLLQVIAGIVQPTSGSVAIQGRIAALLELGTGFKPELTGRQNVYLCGAIQGLSRREIDSFLAEILSFADIGEFIDQPVKTYSSGMYIRLAFSLAICAKPDILIVDEALAVGDTLFQAKCYAKIREFQQQGVTVLVVTHSLDLVNRLCTKAFLLDQGKAIRFGDPKDVIDAYNRIILHQGHSGEMPVPPAGGAAGVQAAADRKRPAGAGYNPTENRYGNGRAIITQVGIYSSDGKPVQDLLGNEEYEFRLDIVFREQVAAPIVSYRIRDQDKADICGTNTLYHNIETGLFYPGDTVVVSFRQRIGLRGGAYFLSASCAGFEKGAYVVYDRRYDLLPFRVVAPRPCDGHVDLHAGIVLHREKGTAVRVHAKP